MIVQNNSTKRTFHVGGVAIPPGKSMTVPDDSYDDISALADLAVTSGVPTGGGRNYSKQPAFMQGGGTIVDVSGMIIVSSDAPVDADGRPDGTIYIQTA